jgi:hypothetical protein
MKSRYNGSETVGTFSVRTDTVLLLTRPLFPILSCGHTAFIYSLLFSRAEHSGAGRCGSEVGWVGHSGREGII